MVQFPIRCAKMKRATHAVAQAIQSFVYFALYFIDSRLNLVFLFATVHSMRSVAYWFRAKWNAHFCVYNHYWWSLNVSVCQCCKSAQCVYCLVQLCSRLKIDLLCLVNCIYRAHRNQSESNQCLIMILLLCGCCGSVALSCSSSNWMEYSTICINSFVCTRCEYKSWAITDRNDFHCFLNRRLGDKMEDKSVRASCRNI